MNKSFRQGQILKLIRTRSILTQEELAHALAESFNIQATQVTLSRDIRELGLVKTQEGYRQMSAPSGPDLATIAAEFLFDVRQAQNLIVLKTSPAHASSVAVALDTEELPEIVGTLAGDDTVLVITPDVATASKLRERLLAFVKAEQ
jgi:transcriptional regulator of arginine metabolism